jgi:hypothetical protein
MLPPVGRSTTWGWRAAARSGEPSVEPLSASTTSTGRTVAVAREAMNSSSRFPGE